MQRNLLSYLVALALGLWGLLGLHAGEARAEPSLSAEEIMQKAAAKAERESAQSVRPDYLYHKFTVTEEYGGDGKMKERKERFYIVRFHRGLSHLHLTKLNGVRLAGADLKREEDLEVSHRRKLTFGRSGKADNRENFLTSELVGKYNFTLLGEEAVNGRPAYALTFQPKSNLPNKHVTDRLLNQLSGKVWIDEEDFEIAKGEIRLQAEVALWGGLLGSLSKFSFTLERTRIDDGVWFNKSSSGDFEGRKLLEPTRIKTRSESSDFRRLQRTETTSLSLDP